MGWVDIQMIKSFSSQEAVLAHPEWNSEMAEGGGARYAPPPLKKSV